jgi:tight adherence protein B
MFWVALVVLMIGLAFVLMLLVNVEAPSDVEVTEADRRDPVPEAITNYLAANGVELPAVVIYSAIASLAAMTVLSGILLPVSLAAIIVFTGYAGAFLSIKFIGSKRRAKMLEQLPSFINQVTRRLSAGVSVENAFADSVETLERPLGTIMRRIVRRVHLGYDLHQAFSREAAVTKLHEFNVIATALRINEQYGGSIRSILDDIVGILRMDEAGKRELRALTGETRFTAVVLALLPPLIAVYMFSVNPDMMLEVWSQSSGKSLFIISAVMEILGVLVLWRMVNSIES